MKVPNVRRFLPSWKNALLAVIAATLLILAFPDFEYWFLAWFALVPLLWAVDREKESAAKSFVLGWLFGIVFFFGTCWWLTFAPITYAGFPVLLAYFLLFCVTVIVGLFPAIFAVILSVLLKRFGNIAILAAPFIWVATEFARYWITGNNWNAIAYSQAFSGWGIKFASVGGIYLTACVVLFGQSLLAFLICRANDISSDEPLFYPKALHTLFGELGLAVFLFSRSVRQKSKELDEAETVDSRTALLYCLVVFLWPLVFFVFLIVNGLFESNLPIQPAPISSLSSVVAIQPDVPMDGLNEPRWRQLRLEHTVLAERALNAVAENPQSAIRNPQSTVIFPESPMNFMFHDDPEFQAFIHAFAAKNNVNVLFNSAEPDPANKKYFNSAVMVDPQGREVAQYDKIYLLPFGESVPFPLQNFMPALVGSFSYGKDYTLFPLGDAKAGVMICFESHFPDLSREYVRRGADAIIEMTNDGYLGQTPVLRQHLANAVFRAVETNRPVLRVTNVGITAYINERGEVIDPAQSYTEATRVWTVGKSDGSQTFYVKYGDWFAWLSVIVTLVFLTFTFWKKNQKIAAS